jgi:hypothetical protein
MPSGDSDPPAISNLDPQNGATDIDAFSNLTFTLSDNGSGVDWNTFEIQLSGDNGYSKLYTDTDFLIVTKTGIPAMYNVTVNPDIDFGHEEIITVTVRADDYDGNPLTFTAWSFTTAPEAVTETLVLHPSGVHHAGGFTTSGGTGWSDVLDSNDGLTSHAHKCGGAGYPSDPVNSHFSVDMDDSGLINNEHIQKLDIGIVVKYAPSCPTSGTATGTMQVCYDTGEGMSCQSDVTVSGDFSLYEFLDIDTNLDISDIDDIRIEVRRKSSGSIHLIVTEIYVEVYYNQ